MVKICFKRIGKPKHPFYRVIVLDKQKDPHGNYLENLGTYDAHTKEAKLNADKIKEWIAKGAQASATVHNLLVTNKIIDAAKKRASSLTKRHRDRLAAKSTTSPATKPVETTAMPSQN